MKKVNVAVENRSVSEDQMSDYFEIFSFPRKYDIDRSELDEKYFALQQKHHPDRFIGKSNKERVETLQKSVTINEGYGILKSPLKRAEHLLLINGLNTDSPNQDLLMEVMEYKEALESENSIETKKKIQKDIDNTIENLKKAFYENNLEEATKLTIRLKYFERM